MNAEWRLIQELTFTFTDMAKEVDFNARRSISVGTCSGTPAYADAKSD